MPYPMAKTTTIKHTFCPSFFRFDVRRTLWRSCAASHTSQRVQTWTGTTPTTRESCPAQLPRVLSWAPTGRASLATSIARAFPQTFPVLLACTGTNWKVGPSQPKIRGFRVSKGGGRICER